MAILFFNFLGQDLPITHYILVHFLKTRFWLWESRRGGFASMYLQIVYQQSLILFLPCKLASYCHQLFSHVETTRILYECQGWIDKSILRVTLNLASQGMPSDANL